MITIGVLFWSWWAWGRSWGKLEWVLLTWLERRWRLEASWLLEMFLPSRSHMTLIYLRTFLYSGSIQNLSPHFSCLMHTPYISHLLPLLSVSCTSLKLAPCPSQLWFIACSFLMRCVLVYHNSLQELLCFLLFQLKHLSGDLSACCVSLPQNFFSEYFGHAAQQSPQTT